MPENAINCQNLACPEPVIRTKRFLEAHNPTALTVVVDNEAARDNVARLLQSSGFNVETVAKDSLFHLVGTKDHAFFGSTEQVVLEKRSHNGAQPQEDEKILILVNAEVFGTGNEILGAKLMQNFFSTLPELLPHLWRIIFLNSGVKLCVKDSPVIDHIKNLEQQGVSILACGTCLEHYGLLRDKAVGETTNMLDVVTSMLVADKVIRP